MSICFVEGDTLKLYLVAERKEMIEHNNKFIGPKQVLGDIYNTTYTYSDAYVIEQVSKKDNVLSKYVGRDVDIFETTYKRIQVKGSVLDVELKEFVEKHSIRSFYNLTKHTHISSNSLWNEAYKKRQDRIYVLSTDDLRYIPTQKHLKPRIQDAEFIKVFNTFYKDTILNELELYGLTEEKYYSTSAITLKDENSINLNLFVKGGFIIELVKHLKTVLPDIVDKMFEGKLTTVFNELNLDKQELVNEIAKHLSIHTNFNLTFKGEKENEGDKSI